MSDSVPTTEHTDIDPESFGRALLTATAGNPGELLDRLRQQLLESPRAIDLTMHLIDYRLSSLRPIEINLIDSTVPSSLLRPEPVTHSEVGTAYRMQNPTQHTVPAGQPRHVPISVRGQRLGVLTATFADIPSRADCRLLNSLALAAAFSLLESSTGTDVYETHRRHGRLSIAAELQWQLLPPRAFQTPHFYVAGHLEPALRVAGDAFDFVVNDKVFTLAVVDATGTDAAPSVFTTLVVTALRNAHRSGLTLPEQASLANDILWQYSRGREQAPVLLMQLDARSGDAVVVDAGSPAILRMREGRHQALTPQPQTPLGMFADTEYREEAIDLRAGDRVYVLTDGAFTHCRTVNHIANLLETPDAGAPHPPPEAIRQLVAILTNDGEEPEMTSPSSASTGPSEREKHRSLGPGDRTVETRQPRVAQRRPPGAWKRPCLAAASGW